jgi:hypothetical protein
MRSALRWTVVAVLVLHGLIHLLGVVKGFGWAEVARLEEPVGPVGALVWLVAAVSVLVAAVMLAVRAPAWWAVALGAALISQAAIFTKWEDASVGTAANLVLVVAAAYGFAATRRTEHRADSDRASVSTT